MQLADWHADEDRLVAEATGNSPITYTEMLLAAWRGEEARASELIEIVRLLEPCTVVGTDLMEVAHVFDPSGRTGITASWILREAILTWWGK